MDKRPLTLEQRRERLQAALATQMTPSVRIEAQNDTSATIAFAGGVRRTITITESGRCEFVDYPAVAPAFTTGTRLFLAALAAFCVLGLLLATAFVGGFDPHDLNTETDYNVTSSLRRGARVDITYATDNGSLAQERDIALPWRYRSDRFLWGRTMHVSAVNRSDGCITVEIRRNGKVRKTVESCGRGAVAVARY